MAEPGAWIPVTGPEFARIRPDRREAILMAAMAELLALELILRLAGPVAAGSLYAAGGRSRIGPGGELEVRWIPLPGRGFSERSELS